MYALHLLMKHKPIFSSAADEGASFPFKGNFSSIVCNYSAERSAVLFHKEDELGFAEQRRSGDKAAHKGSHLCFVLFSTPCFVLPPKTQV